MIETNNLHFRYDNSTIEAVNNLNICVTAGEFVAILGANGTGKSTLARLINALLLPTSGEIRIAGLLSSEPDNIWQIRSHAGLVFQNPDNQIIATTVEDDVAFGPENLGIAPDEIRRRVDEALRLVNMTEYRDRSPHLLSGGQKQRVAIAGILAMRPQMIILDEATAMLDPSGRGEVMDTILRLNREEHITIVHITHFMEEAVRADRVIVMDGGEIRLDGTPREVFSDTELIKGLGLDVPQAAEVANKLISKGVNLPRGILDAKELSDALYALITKTTRG